MAKARALRDRMSEAIQVSYHNLIVEVDNKTVIQALYGTIQVLWQIQHIIHDILTRKAQGIQIIINHIFRKANMARGQVLNLGILLEIRLSLVRASYHYSVQF